MSRYTRPRKPVTSSKPMELKPIVRSRTRTVIAAMSRTRTGLPPHLDKLKAGAGRQEKAGDSFTPSVGLRILARRGGSGCLLSLLQRSAQKRKTDRNSSRSLFPWPVRRCGVGGNIGGRCGRRCRGQIGSWTVIAPGPSGILDPLPPCVKAGKTLHFRPRSANELPGHGDAGEYRGSLFPRRTLGCRRRVCARANRAKDMVRKRPCYRRFPLAHMYKAALLAGVPLTAVRRA